MVACGPKSPALRRFADRATVDNAVDYKPTGEK